MASVENQTYVVRVGRRGGIITLPNPCGLMPNFDHISRGDHLTVEALLEEAKQLREWDIRFEELGSRSGFQEAEDLKNEAVDYCLRILELLREHLPNLSDHFVSDALKATRFEIGGLAERASNIANLADPQGPDVGGGLHDPEFPTQRMGEIEGLKKDREKLEGNLDRFETRLLYEDLKQRLPDPAQLLEVRERSDQVLDRVQEVEREAEKALANLQKNIMTTGVDRSQAGFGDLAVGHRSTARVWLGSLMAAGVALLFALRWLILSELPVTPEGTVDATRAISTALKQLASISVAALLLKLCLSKYNTERHLQITYEHRTNVLDQYGVFEAAIGDDAASKNQFRMEVAKYLFSDPKTGYVPGGNDGDFNINPVISVADAMTSRN